jgi:repressor LexA
LKSTIDHFIEVVGKQLMTKRYPTPISTDVTTLVFKHLQQILDAVLLNSMLTLLSSSPTLRQQEIAAFLAAESRQQGMMPTHREIAAKFGFASPNSVRTHLRLMEKKGMLERVPGKARSLKLTVSIPSVIPLLGNIAAGTPQEAIQSTEEFLPLPAQFFGGTEMFALRVKGDSMKDVGILSGDIAVIKRQEDVADGEIAAVLLDAEATLKFVHRQSGAVILRGANPAFSEIVVRPDESQALRILGKYVGLVRKHGRAL